MAQLQQKQMTATIHGKKQLNPELATFMSSMSFMNIRIWTSKNSFSVKYYFYIAIQVLNYSNVTDNDMFSYFDSILDFQCWEKFQLIKTL